MISVFLLSLVLKWLWGWIQRGGGRFKTAVACSSAHTLGCQVEHVHTPMSEKAHRWNCFLIHTEIDQNMMLNSGTNDIHNERNDEVMCLCINQTSRN